MRNNVYLRAHWKNTAEIGTKSSHSKLANTVVPPDFPRIWSLYLGRFGFYEEQIFITSTCSRDQKGPNLVTKTSGDIFPNGFKACKHRGILRFAWDSLKILGKFWFL